MKFARAFVLILMSCFLSAAPVMSKSAAGHGPVAFTLIHVNDTHSHFTPSVVDLTIPGTGMSARVPLGSVSRMAAAIRQIREEEPRVLFLHAGDMVQGSLYYTLFNGRADADVYTAMALDAMAVGNHEFDHGTDGLATLLSAAGFPVVSGNLATREDPRLAGRIAPYIIKKIGGERVAVIGLIMENLAEISSPSAETTVEPVAETAARTIEMLTREGIQIIVLLTHLGLRSDLALARSVRGVDIIVGGHSHTLLGSFEDLGLEPAGAYPTEVSGPDGSTVLVVHAWEHTKLLGRLHVQMDAAGRVASWDGKPVLLAGTPESDEDGNHLDAGAQASLVSAMKAHPGIFLSDGDPAMDRRIAEYSRNVAAYGNQVIGVAPETLRHIRVPDSGHPGGSQVAPVISDAFLWKLGLTGKRADIAFQNAGGVRSDIAAGEITGQSVHTLMPFQNGLIVFEMTGGQILTLLDRAMDRVFGKEGLDGAFPYAAGLRYTLARGRDGNVQVSEAEVRDGAGHWEALTAGRVYRVVVNSYMAGGGDGYTDFVPLQGYETGFIDTQVFMDYVSTRQRLLPEETGVRLVAD